MRSTLFSGALAATLAAATPAPAQTVESEAAPTSSGARTVRITYENLTTGQILSPPAFASHNGRAPAFFQPGTQASFQLQHTAEEGNPGPFFSALIVPNLGDEFLSGDTTISALPGQKRSVMLRVSREYPLVSGVFMLVRTNDGFSGLNALDVLSVNERRPFLVALEGSRRDPTHQNVALHPGLRTRAADPQSDVPPLWDFDPAKPVVKITITAAGG